MTRLLLTGLLLSASALGFVVPNPSNSIFEKIESIPRGWTRLQDASPSDPVTLSISVREQNFERFEQLVLDVSTPDHEKYGQHLEGHEVAAFLRPHEHATRSVVDWLKANGVDSIYDHGEWIDFKSNVATAEKLLDTEFAWYRHETGEAKLRTMSYSLPDGVAEHVNFVSPTIKFSTNRPLRSMVIPQSSKFQNPGAVQAYNDWRASLGPDVDPSAITPPDAVCNQVITPQCLLKLYNVHYGAPNNTKTKLAFASFLKEYARYTDLEEFSATIAQYTIGRNFSVTQFNGGGNNQTDVTDDSVEANLDAQYVVGVGHPVPVTEFSTGGCGPLIPDPGEPAGACDNEPYVQFLRGVLALPNSALPQVISVSYGEDEQTWPLNVAKKVCNMLAQLGGRGTTVLFASGDNGPAGSGDYCEDNSGKKSMFVPSFPTSCPFVTVVGATQNIPEVVASFSGGGFSNYFAMPSYQTTAVASYKKFLGTKFSQYYNKTGRAYPDVAAQGLNFLVVDKGATVPVAGTSASTPVFSSLVALLNAARASQGKSSVGFLNPFLYSNATKAFNDIVNGMSTGCTKGTTIPGAGWNATKGWDAATGLGTPNFGALLKLVAPGVANTGGPVS